MFYGRTAPDTNSPGIDANSILRDPWGLPYIITQDMNGDGQCADPVVWQKLYRNAGITNFTVTGSAMVWSFGPMKRVELGQRFDSATNRSLVTSW
jgi:hypothetical protein